MRRYQSRLLQVEERRSIRSAIVYGGLTVFVIILVIVVGIPLLSKFIGLFSKSSGPSVETVKTILAAPNIETPPQYVKDQSLTIKGTAIPDSSVIIYVNNSSQKAVGDENGNFSANISLSRGNNIIYAIIQDKNGNESRPSDKYSVNYTNKEPSLTVNSPQNNQQFYGDKQKNISVEGSTDSGNSVTINDHIAILDSNGKFSLMLGLNDGDNEIKVISTDLAGNKKEITLKVIFNP